MPKEINWQIFQWSLVPHPSIGYNCLSLTPRHQIEKEVMLKNMKLPHFLMKFGVHPSIHPSNNNWLPFRTSGERQDMPRNIKLADCSVEFGA